MSFITEKIQRRRGKRKKPNDESDTSNESISLQNKFSVLSDMEESDEETTISPVIMNKTQTVKVRRLQICSQN